MQGCLVKGGSKVGGEEGLKNNPLRVAGRGG